MSPVRRVGQRHRVADPAVHRAAEVFGRVDGRRPAGAQRQPERVRAHRRLVPPPARHESHPLAAAPHDAAAVGPHDAAGAVCHGGDEVAVLGRAAYVGLHRPHSRGRRASPARPRHRSGSSTGAAASSGSTHAADRRHDSSSMRSGAKPAGWRGPEARPVPSVNHADHVRVSRSRRARNSTRLSTRTVSHPTGAPAATRTLGRDAAKVR